MNANYRALSMSSFPANNSRCRLPDATDEADNSTASTVNELLSHLKLLDFFSLTVFKLWMIMLILIYWLMVTAAGLQGQWRDARLRWSSRTEGTAPTSSDTGVKSALSTP